MCDWADVSRAFRARIAPQRLDSLVHLLIFKELIRFGGESVSDLYAPVCRQERRERREKRRRREGERKEREGEGDEEASRERERERWRKEGDREREIER